MVSVIWLRLAALDEPGARRMSRAVLLLILLALSLCSALHAVLKPFWYDELCTVIICRLPTASALWNALESGADSNPPLYYYILRATRHVILDDHLGYRLPSIIGLLGTISFLFVTLSRRMDRLSSLLGATFVLCTPMVAYAYEARPYALMVCCISAAICAWQRMDDAKFYALLTALALALAVSLHYYAIFVWPAFILAEASLWFSSRRFRRNAWGALVLGAAPLLLYAHILLHLRHYFGRNFWARPSYLQIFSAHDRLFPFGNHWGLTFTLGITAAFIACSVSDWKPCRTSSQQNPEASSVPLAERVLAFMLLWLPLFGVTVAKISHGGMTPRYLLPTLLGGALIMGYLAGKVSVPARVLLLVLILANYGMTTGLCLAPSARGHHYKTRESVERDLDGVLAQQRESGLPLVVSSGIQFLPLVYYAPTDSGRNIYAFTDPSAAVTYTGTDSLDLDLLVMQKYFPLQAVAYSLFSSRYREFLLVSNPEMGSEDWWPERLLHDGHSLNLIRKIGNFQIFKVTLNAMKAP